MSGVYCRSTAGLRAGQSGTADAIARLHSTMSASLQTFDGWFSLSVPPLPHLSSIGQKLDKIKVERVSNLHSALL